MFRQLASDLQATNDFFIRTTDAGHKAFVQDFLERLRANGHVYEGTYAGLYCDACEAFYRENELVDGKCPIHGTEVRFLEERNWFFRLSAFADPLLAHYDAQRDFVVPRSRYNEARSFIEAGLTTCRSPAPRCSGASRCRGTRSRRSTSGSTRCSTTRRRSPTPGRART